MNGCICVSVRGRKDSSIRRFLRAAFHLFSPLERQRGKREGKQGVYAHIVYVLSTQPNSTYFSSLSLLLFSLYHCNSPKWHPHRQNMRNHFILLSTSNSQTPHRNLFFLRITYDNRNPTNYSMACIVSRELQSSLWIGYKKFREEISDKNKLEKIKKNLNSIKRQI